MVFIRRFSAIIGRKPTLITLKIIKRANRQNIGFVKTLTGGLNGPWQVAAYDCTTIEGCIMLAKQLRDFDTAETERRGANANWRANYTGTDYVYFDQFDSRRQTYIGH